MNTDYKIFVVDDDKTTRLLLESLLGKRYAVEAFDSGEACQNRLAQQLPDLFLLDVGLPGLDGYDLCRKIKELPEGSRLPVIFVSGRDDPSDILAGYDAGGEDYVVKPIDIAVLTRKIENLRRIGQDRGSLVGQAQAADELATLVLANLDEYAVLIKFLRTLNECVSYGEIVDAVLHLLGVFHLDGAVQVRLREVETTRSRAGENWPLEIAVIKHVRTLERIFEFKRHAAYNFDHLTILITNMPVEDADLCGRIRDNLAIAAESADAKLTALQSFADNAKLRQEIDAVLQAVGSTVESYGERYDGARYRGSLYTSKFLDDLLVAFAHLGMTSQQEEEMLEMVRERSSRLADIYDVAGETQATLGVLRKKLESTLATTGDGEPQPSAGTAVHGDPGRAAAAQRR